MKKQFSQPKRILLKLSGEALQGNQQFGIDFDYVSYLCDKVIKLFKENKIQIVIVIGGGNIFRGISSEKHGFDRASGDYMGMLATIINGIAIGEVLEKKGSQVRIMSAIENPKVSELFIRRRALKHLENGRIVICVAGTGNPYFTTDSAAVLRALELNCNFLVKGTNVDGVYDKDPKIHKDAKKFGMISISDALKNGLRIMDQSAIALAKDEKLPIFVCKIDDIDKIGTENINGTHVYID